MSKEPMVPLHVAELLHVVLATAQHSGQLDERTQDNVKQVLKLYTARRDISAKEQGFKNGEVKDITAAAAEALADWLEDRALKEETVDSDLAEWESEFDAQTDHDPAS